jgi:7-keto-8-aminopelargonate synthetase-like enzyme
MRKKIFNQVYSIIKSGMDLGLGHVVTDNNGFYPINLSVKGKKLVNFALLDYLALSNDDRVKQGAINAIQTYGACTTFSKTYANLDIYVQAEEYLSKIFNRPVLLFARTTLAHIGVLPVITDMDEAIILDHQVHTSVRLAADLIKSYGNYVETIRHNRMDILEERIKDLSAKYSKVWYLADGVYSIFGDTIPSDAIYGLLNKYEKFHVYVDDAHGMSWTGENGKGFVLNSMPYHQRMVVTTSLGKGFGSGGGVVICHDNKMKEWISACAAPLMFTSPVCPSTLGAIIESAKIHLTSEIYTRQTKLKDNIDLFNNTARGLDLPLLNNPDIPLTFIATGEADISREICLNLIKNGYFASVSQFPAVPVNNSGIRAAVNLLHTKDEIFSLLKLIREEYFKALKRRNMSMGDVLKHFKTMKEEKVF